PPRHRKAALRPRPPTGENGILRCAPRGWLPTSQARFVDQDVRQVRAATETPRVVLLVSSVLRTASARLDCGSIPCYPAGESERQHAREGPNPYDDPIARAHPPTTCLLAGL